MPPDFGNANLILGIIGAGAALVYFFYRLQFALPMIQGMLRGNQKSAEERSLDLLQQYQKEGSWIHTDSRTINAISPRFHMLRAAIQDGTVACYVINKGGTASSLRIETEGPHQGSITPNTSLANGQTGNIALHGVGGVAGRLQFTLSYDDALGMRVMRSYQYAPAEQKFIEV
ncbi:MAG: hypothetical protein AAF564_11150 [Bacteroidota bacterium]